MMTNRAPIIMFLLLTTSAALPASVPETRLDVSLPRILQGGSAGRLLVFAAPATVVNAADLDIDAAEIGQPPVWMAAADIANFDIRGTAVLNTEELAYPDSFSALPPGEYRFQAVLDRNGDYGYAGRGPGDLVSNVVTLRWPQIRPATLQLNRVIPQIALWDFSAFPASARAHIAAMRASIREAIIPSPVLTAFWGRPTPIRAWILLPPDYDASKNRRWPTVYQTNGFGSTHKSDLALASNVWRLMAEHKTPAMIWVFLDHSGMTGTTEFADSVNNGPWGEALTSELIPTLEKSFRMDGRASGRFLTGHSSGGWAALWLQLSYRGLFGGSWATAPDSSDFHSFSGVDLGSPGLNMYTDADGLERPLVRDRSGNVVATVRSYARREAVLGQDGGQLRSFEWVFSPRGSDGRPMKLFDRATGAVDPSVASYWRAEYDISAKLGRLTGRSKAGLAGKIHVFVGSQDEYYLDSPALDLRFALASLNIKAEIVVLAGKGHGDLSESGGDRQALDKNIAWAMYHVAHPRFHIMR